jgi:hypothetical protein
MPLIRIYHQPRCHTKEGRIQRVLDLVVDSASLLHILQSKERIRFNSDLYDHHMDQKHNSDA